MKNFYTFYCTDGKRKACFGSDHIEAFKVLGHKNIGLIEFFEPGITDSHIWNTAEEQWEPRTNQHHVMSAINALFTLPVKEAAFSIKALVTNSDINKISVDMENKDRYIFSLDWKQHDLGWIKKITVSHGSYRRSNDDEASEDCYYIIRNKQFFAPCDMEDALKCFLKRLTEDHKEPVGESSTLQDIYDRQRPEIVYGDLTSREQLFLLKHFTEELRQHPSVKDSLRNGFLTRLDGEQHSSFNRLWSDIQCLCDSLFITRAGQRHYTNEDLFEAMTGFKFLVGEQDACGPLSMVIKTQFGKIVYG